MKDAILFKLLLIVKGNGNITELKKDGHSYVRIAEFVKYLVDEELAEKKDGKLSLSDIGMKRLKELNKKHDRKNFTQWIVPEDRSRVDKLDKSFVYLPNQNELNF